MSDVHLQRPLKIPPVAAFAALREILAGISSQTGVWREFTVHAGLGALHLPDVGYLAIPIRLETGEQNAETHAIPIVFTAARNAASFPTFRGQVGIDTTGPSGSTFWLGGAYDVPWQLFGRLLDATIAAGVADRSLENLAEDLAAAIAATVEKREAEYVHYRLSMR